LIDNAIEQLIYANGVTVEWIEVQCGDFCHCFLL
jgi:hypothetical protein